MPLHSCTSCGRLSPLTPKCGGCKYGKRRRFPRVELSPVEYSPEYRQWAREMLISIRAEQAVKLREAA